VTLPQISPIPLDCAHAHYEDADCEE
jgi:hypothetical protein